MHRRLALALALLAPALLAPAHLACQPAQRPDGGHGHLGVDDPAPDLRAVDHRGREVALRDLRGAPVLVYFYPKDGTPGCTKEACAIRDIWSRFTAAGVVVLGVSTDDAASHRKFADEHQLPFSLIADTDLTWARAFGVGTTLGMTQRVSFLLDRGGRIARVYPDVDPGVHAEQVLADAAALPPPEVNPG